MFNADKLWGASYRKGGRERLIGIVTEIEIDQLITLQVMRNSNTTFVLNRPMSVHCSSILINRLLMYVCDCLLTINFPTLWEYLRV